MIIQDDYIYFEETDIMDVTLALIECGVGVSKKEYDKNKKIVLTMSDDAYYVSNPKADKAVCNVLLLMHLTKEENASIM